MNTAEKRERMLTHVSKFCKAQAPSELKRLTDIIQKYTEREIDQQWDLFWGRNPKYSSQNITRKAS